MSLPVMRRGLSPEGRRNRDRQLGSLTIGLQGVTVHPTHRGKSETNFIAENVRRLHQIQTKCRQRGTTSRAPQPLRATRHPLLSQLEGSDGSVGGMVKRQSVERDGSAHSDYFSLSEDQPDAPPPSLYSGEVVAEEEEQVSHPPSPLHLLSVPPQEGTQEPVSQLSALSLTGSKLPSKMGYDARPLSPDGHNSRSQSPVGHSFRQQSPNILKSRLQSPLILSSRPNSPVVLEPIATRLTQTKPKNFDLGPGNSLSSHQRMLMGGSGSNSRQNVVSNEDFTGVGVIEPGAGLGNLGLLGAEPLSPEGRKQRMDNIMSRIKSQKPSCEIDFNKHYKAIENQHRMLLDNSERLSLYGSWQGSRENLSRSRSRSNSRPGSAGSVRSVSLDRNACKNTKGNNDQKSVRPSTVMGEVSGFRHQIHPMSPQTKKKSVKTSDTKNRTNVEPLTGGGQKGRKQAAGERDKITAQKYQKENLSKVRNLTRAKSNLERSPINTENHTSLAEPQSTSKQNHVVDTRSDLDRIHSSVEDRNINSTISSASDFILVGGDLLDNQEPRLKLNIRPDSNASDVNGRDCVQYLESSRDVFSLDSCNLHYYEQATGGGENVGVVDKYLNQNVKDVSENNVEMRHIIESEKDHLENINSESIYNPEGVESLGNQKHLMITERTDNSDHLYEKTDKYGRQCKDNNEISVNVVTSTLVPNTSNHATSSRNNSPQLKTTQGGDNEFVRGRTEQATSRSALRRSQSLKNIKQQQQQQQRRPGDVPLTYKKGKIPRYLAARREEERRAAEAALAVDPACPPGHSPLPDSDRLNTLHLLRRSQSEVLHELASLPVAQDTLRVKRARQDLEDKLTQIEDGLRIFSQPKVYIMNDE